MSFQSFRSARMKGALAGLLVAAASLAAGCAASSRPDRNPSSSVRENSALFSRVDRLQLPGWPVPESLGDLSSENVANLAREVGSLSPQEGRLAKRLRALPLLVSTRRSTASRASVRARGGILTRKALREASLVKSSAFAVTTEEDLFGASEWAFATLSMAGWKGNIAYGQVLYRVQDRYWQNSSWATEASGLKIYEEFAGIERGEGSMGGIPAVQIPAARAAFRRKIIGPEQYSDFLTLRTIRFLRAADASTRMHFFAADAADLPALLGEHRLGYLEVKAPGFPAEALEEIPE